MIQDGFVLAAVLGCLLVIAVMAIALLSMTSTAARVTSSSAVNNDRLRAIDSSLERALNEARTFEDPALRADCSSWSNGYNNTEVLADGYSVFVTCESQQAQSTAELRVFDLTAWTSPDPSATRLGRVRARAYDWANGRESPGYIIEVCDWQVVGAMTNDSLRDCPVSAGG